MSMKFPSSELQTATDGTGRVSFVMKGLSSERNNVYLVNVVVTNVATGEMATYEVPPASRSDRIHLFLQPQFR
jgi:hypothetical protein